MPAVKRPDDEADRLAALLDLGILGTDHTVEFDIFPSLAKNLLSTPMAAVSLVDGERQWFKASAGLPVRETPRDYSFCAHAILAPSETLYVPDAAQDPRFADSPLVTGGMGIRFYAGAPIIGPGGHALGALCVLDSKPREVDPHLLEQLRHLAVGVGSALKLHASVNKLAELASTDALTGLPNRAAFDMQIRAALARKDHPGLQAGLLFLDLDGFKPINDLFGHAGGDAALQEVARRLQQAAERRATVFRFGGDEFCILMGQMDDRSSLQLLAARVHAALRAPFFLNRHSVPLRTSIGIAVGTPGASDAADLVCEADAALYEAKRAGASNTRFATVSRASDGLGAAGRKRIEQLLRNALSRPGLEPFTVALQPIFQGRTGCLAGFEALVRWPQPDGRMMMPGDFIPVAEATGLVVPLDRWVLDQSCRLAAGWPSHLQVSSNLSAANFFAGDLAGDVRAALQRHGLAPGCLTLEITETVLLRDPARVRTVVAALREMGVHVVLDDFGVGHASIAYLRDYAFDGLKIDRSFVSGIETDARSRAFVRAIIEMARALKISATAEGVETDGQLQALRKKGVESMQGYLLGRPMTVEAAEALIRSQSATA